jgi:hypothetical protein
MHNLFLYSVVFSLGLVSFITCFAAEFKRTQVRRRVPSICFFILTNRTKVYLCRKKIFDGTQRGTAMYPEAMRSGLDQPLFFASALLRSLGT